MREPERIAGMDGLRGAAVLSVVLYHADLFPLGRTSVELFFGISGLLITAILLRAKAAESTLWAYIKPFYARRALRILPLAWVIAFIVAATTGYWRGTLPYDAYYSNALFDRWSPRELGHYWTLAVEEQFYLLWPFVVFALRPRQLLAVCAAIPFVETAVRAALIYLQPEFFSAHPLGRPTLLHFEPIAVGAALALAMHSGWPLVSVRLERTLLVLAAGSWAVLDYSVTNLGRLAGTQYILETFLLTICVGAILNMILRTKPRWLEWKPLVFVGTISYGVYLIHGAITFPVRQAIQNPALHLLVLAGLSITAAWLSWQYFESPILALKRHFPMPRRAKPA